MKKMILAFVAMILSFAAPAQKINTELTWLVKEPTVKTTKTPVLIMLHGYGSNESDLFDISKVIDQRFIVFSLRAPHPAGSGYAWYALEFLADQQFSYDYKEARQSRAQVLSFISKACAAYGVDSTQVFLMGFSQGAILAYDMALAAPKKIKGVLALSGRLMEESKSLKTDWLKVAGVKFFIAHGNSDNVIKIADAEKARDFLRSKKVTDLTYKEYQMPHILNGQELNDIKSWLVKALNPKGEDKKK